MASVILLSVLSLGVTGQAAASPGSNPNKAPHQPHSEPESSSASAGRQPLFCTQSGPIPAGRLAEGYSTKAGCDIAGRRVVHDNVSVRVPESGKGVGAALLGSTETGSKILRVTNRDGVVRAATTYSSQGSASAVSSRSAQLAPECEYGGYPYLPYDVEELWTWRYNHSTTPDRYDTSQVRLHTRRAIVNIISGHNECPNFEGKPRIGASYQGGTNIRAHIYVQNDTNNCGAEDNADVVDWGRLADNALAYTCWWYTYEPRDQDTIIAADVRMDSQAPLYIQKPTNCFLQYQLQGVMTHEWGHVFGLPHYDYDNHPFQTMSDAINSCTYEVSTLGQGDWNMLKALYGVAN